ncbi:FecR family protein [Pseudoxanthomonas sp. GM95]|uniref:FecR family protein n=1 Tax=Pseudoxanthomonas sp. GM95 TaxID=1881043 RepID=UPI0008B71A39|nr:FecR family protein [Pseudoxanthomonas sp. GM95]SEL79737.1 FecR family protein [Pseudoxanthomonas sp. GM95]
MKRYLCLLALATLAFFAVPALAADDHVALVKTVSGNVQVIRQDATVQAAGGTTLLVSDHLVAGPGASAAIVFKDGTLLTLGPGADILVRDYVFEPKDGKFSFSLYMTKGSAIYESGKIGKLAPDSVKIDTPKATVGVRGTRFLIEAN